ncbi:MAG: hypothetical protein EX268_19280 [Deltaproteobacteria bacterium]|nr:MAG: hypothetical protein EX268_19280 [Deltaproteobacteria bacterium]
MSAGASDRCTIMYRVDATLEVSDTDFKKGDTTEDGFKGSFVLEFARDEQGQAASAEGTIRSSTSSPSLSSTAPPAPSTV